MKNASFIARITEWLIKRPIWGGLIAFSILLLLTGTLIYQRYQILREEEKNRTEQVLKTAQGRIRQVIEQTSTATLALSFIIDEKGHPNNFDSVASTLLQNNRYIDALELVPNGVIRYVYPLEGNESVLGYNILADSGRQRDAIRAVETNRLYFAGPLALRQGGMGVIGRLPVYRNGKFWGFSAAIISLQRFLSAAGIDTSGNSGYYFQLSRTNDLTGQKEYFLPPHQFRSNGAEAEITITEGEWLLTAAPLDGNRYIRNLILLLVLGFFLPLLAGVFTMFLFKRPEDLQYLVEKRTEELTTSQENLHQILESMADDYYVVDKDFNVTLINEYAQENLFKSWGKRVDIGSNILEMVPPDRREQIRRNFERVMKGEPLEYEIEVFWGGEHHWRTVSYSPVYDAQGKIKGANIITRNITNQKLAAEALRKSEQKYRTLIEQASDAIVVYNIDGKLTEFNESALRYTGYKKEEIDQFIIRDFLFEEDLKNEPLRFEELMQGDSVTDQRRIKRKDGTGFLAELHSKLLPDGNVMAIARDITEKKNAELALRSSEEKYRSLIEQASDGVVICKPDGSITQVNQSLVILSGYTESELLQMSLKDLLPPENLIQGMPLFPSLGKESSQVFEKKLQRKDGRLVDIEINAKLTHTNMVIGFIRDISIRKQAEAEIMNSELRFRTLTANAPVGIFQCDGSGKTIYVNDSWLSFTGRSYDEVISNGWESVVHPEDLAQVWTRWIQKQEESMEEFRVVGKNEEIHWVSGKLVPLFDKDGELAGFIGTISDITDRKIAEEKIRESQLRLAESEARLKAIIEQAPDAVYLCEPSDGRIVEVNPVGTLQLGYSREELLQMYASDLDVEFNCREKLKGVWNELRLNEPIQLETRHRRKDGSFLPIELKTSRIRVGEHDYIIGFVRDISERKKAEIEILVAKERYEQIAVATNDALWEDDLEAGKTWWNLKHYQYYGHNPELPPLPHEAWQDRIHPDEKRAIIHSFQEAFQKGESFWESEYRFRMPDESYKFVNDRVYFYYRSGKMVKMIGSMTDITERKISEQRLRESEEQHRLLSEQLRELTDHLQNVREEERMHVAREIHDELGQQLTVLKMDVSWLQKKLSPADAQVDEKLKNLLKLIDTTVKTVRKISSELRPSMLDDLGLEAALEWHSQEFQQRSGIKIHLQADIPDIKLPSKVTNGLFRIYQESLTNIARHAEATEVQVVLREDTGHLLLTISDNGNGFARSSIENKKTLGILGMRERAKMLGGGFEIVSAKGKGTSIRIVIPVSGLVQ